SSGRHTSARAIGLPQHCGAAATEAGIPPLAGGWAPPREIRRRREQPWWEGGRQTSREKARTLHFARAIGFPPPTGIHARLRRRRMPAGPIPPALRWGGALKKECRREKYAIRGLDAGCSIGHDAAWISETI